MLSCIFVPSGHAGHTEHAEETAEWRNNVVAGSHMRVGIGYDVHRLKEGRPLILGGVRIPHTHGLDGHSDADVLTHAVCDALLGAMGEGDLGRYYPSDDPAVADMDSVDMLKGVRAKLVERGWCLVNLDTVAVAQSPRLGGYVEAMGKRLAAALQVDASLVHVKVKSHDHLGALGREEGIAAQAVCLLARATADTSATAIGDHAR